MTPSMGSPCTFNPTKVQSAKASSTPFEYCEENHRACRLAGFEATKSCDIVITFLGFSVF